jgi:hypothetical protein
MTIWVPVAVRRCVTHASTVDATSSGVTTATWTVRPLILRSFGNPTRSRSLPILTTDFRTRLLEQDAIYVGGGNTKSALAVWREWGLDTVLREAWESGVLLAGMSAGAMCWYEAGLTDSFWGGELIVRSTALVCCPVVAPFTTAATQRDARRYMPRKKQIRSRLPLLSMTLRPLCT